MLLSSPWPIIILAASTGEKKTIPTQSNSWRNTWCWYPTPPTPNACVLPLRIFAAACLLINAQKGQQFIMNGNRVRFIVIRSLILMTALLLSSAFVVNAQAPGSNRGLSSAGGNSMIQGRVYFPTGQAVSGKTVKVSLESVSAFGSMSTVADQDG